MVGMPDESWGDSWTDGVCRRPGTVGGQHDEGHNCPSTTSVVTWETAARPRRSCLPPSDTASERCGIQVREKAVPNWEAPQFSQGGKCLHLHLLFGFGQGSVTLVSVRSLAPSEGPLDCGTRWCLLPWARDKRRPAPSLGDAVLASNCTIPGLTAVWRSLPRNRNSQLQSCPCCVAVR